MRAHFQTFSVEEVTFDKNVIWYIFVLDPRSVLSIISVMIQF